jgi:hypothetical protein
MNRNKLILLPLCLILLSLTSCNQDNNGKTYNWDNVVDRIWVGENFWANRLQDWEIKDGQLVCIQALEKKPMRTVHLLSSRLENPGNFEVSVLTGLTDTEKQNNGNAASGLLVGAGASLDYRAAALIHHSPGKEGGYFLGVQADGLLFIQNFNDPKKEVLASSMIENLPTSYQITISGSSGDANYQIQVMVSDSSGKELGSVSHTLDESALNGNLALVSHPGSGENTAAFWFDNWNISGEKFNYNSAQLGGPIITAQHTISDNILKINAQLMPIGKLDNQSVSLEIKTGDAWEEVATASIQALSYNALLRVEDFNYTQDVPYRLGYELKENGATSYYEGTFRADPIDKDTIVVAGFTGNHNTARGVEGGNFNWQEQIWFPHTQLVDNMIKHEPDLLFFSGDQIYEGASPSGADRKNKFRDYMYKWYLWCWAYAGITDDIQTVTIPDDHDVFQGNVWGAGGGDTKTDSKGGYVLGAEFVKMVERTQTSHLPDAFDPTPIRTGIGTYYTTLNLGRISLAIIEDRKFKSGPNGLVPPTSGRPDHVTDPNYTYEMADVPEAKLLGERQLKFLDHWAADWKNSDMKMVMSQTIFGNMATHHGADKKFLYMDFDSNGWPQAGRNRALDAIRKGFGFMLGGDQHLATIVHHGIDEQNDAGWSFCVPSIANFYPRAWMPFEKYGGNHIEGLQDYTGEYLDGLGNKVNVFAHTNPGFISGHKPTRLHDRMPGYGIVRLTKSTRQITMECWPRYADPTDPSTGKQYTGWPRTIDMEDNYARKAHKWLPQFKVADIENPVVQVINEANNEIIYTLRIKGQQYDPKVFEDGSYTVKISEPDNNLEKVFSGLIPTEAKGSTVIDVSLK